MRIASKSMKDERYRDPRVERAKEPGRRAPMPSRRMANGGIEATGKPRE
jgi:hypothetical protein